MFKINLPLQKGRKVYCWHWFIFLSYFKYVLTIEYLLVHINFIKFRQLVVVKIIFFRLLRQDSICLARKLQNCSKYTAAVKAQSDIYTGVPKLTFSRLPGSYRSLITNQDILGPPEENKLFTRKLPFEDRENIRCSMSLLPEILAIKTWKSRALWCGKFLGGPAWEDYG